MRKNGLAQIAIDTLTTAGFFVYEFSKKNDAYSPSAIDLAFIDQHKQLVCCIEDEHVSDTELTLARETERECERTLFDGIGLVDNEVMFFHGTTVVSRIKF